MVTTQYSFAPLPLIVAALSLAAPVVQSFSLASTIDRTSSVGSDFRGIDRWRLRAEGKYEEKAKFVPDESAPLLEVKNLSAAISSGEEKQILRGVDLTVNKGEIHAIMGTNGSGKSTLSKVLVGHPEYNVGEGSQVLFRGSSIFELGPDERSHVGLFLAFQYPIELPGVSNEDFLRVAYNAKREYDGEPPVDPLEFMMICTEKLAMVKMDPKFLSRNVNEGFSGGEKKRNEILRRYQ